MLLLILLVLFGPFSVSFPLPRLPLCCLLFQPLTLKGRAQSAREVENSQLNGIPILDLTRCLIEKCRQGVELRVSGTEQLVVSRKDQQVLVELLHQVAISSLAHPQPCG